MAGFGSRRDVFRTLSNSFEKSSIIGFRQDFECVSVKLNNWSSSIIWDGTTMTIKIAKICKKQLKLKVGKF